MTLGFIGKFYLIGVTVEARLWWLSGARVLGSALGLYYYLRVMVTLYMREPGMQMRDAKGDWAVTSGGLGVLRSAIMVVALGIYPQPVISQVQGLQNRVLRQPPIPPVSGTVGHLPDMKKSETGLAGFGFLMRISRLSRCHRYHSA
jgi:formate hydrogenlyase subunit 3/multisubunit Na+/H+ antiporter MnhD subunit